MPIPCCERCYVKYITEDDTIKEQFLQDAFGVDAKVVLSQPEPSPLTIAMRERGHEVTVPMTATVVVDNTETSLCMCDCHKDGCTVFH